MNRRAVWAIVRRDLTVVRQNKAVMIPLIVMPSLFVVLFPFLISLIGRLEIPVSDADLVGLLESVPDWALSALPSESGPQIAGVLLAYMLPPMTLVVPLVFALVIATDAIAGERDRGTLEGLLLAPVSDRDLLAGKLLGALIPALTIGLGGALVYAVIVDTMLWPVTGTLLLPNPIWLLVVLWVGPALVSAALGLATLVSARARSTQGAQQIAGLAVLPVVFLAVGQFSGILFLGPWLLWPVGLLLWLLAALFVWLGSRALARDRLGPRLA